LSARITTIKAASPRDLDEVMRLIRSAVATMSEAGIEQWDEVYPDRATIAADEAEGALWIAADEAGRIVGMIVLNDFQNVEYVGIDWTIAAARVGVVHRLVVHPSVQRRGLAVEMMQFAERKAQELGYDVIRLDAFEHNPTALRLYQRLGYHDAGCVRLRKGIFHCFETRMVKSTSHP
jgi:GNAT superfamily N-acetyltransferase